MEVQASRGEMVARMRQNRIQKLMHRLEEEGIDVHPGEELAQPRTAKRPPPQPEDLEEQATVGRAILGERFRMPSSCLTLQRDRSTSQRRTYQQQQQREEEEEEEEEDAEAGAGEEEVRQLSVAPSTAHHQVKFYEEALESQKRRLIVEQLARQDALNKANSKKINRKSEKILQEKLEQNLMMAIISACPEPEDLLTYDKLGRVLYLLGLFSAVKFDEQCQPRLLPDSPDRSLGVQKFQDMMFHEQLWVHLAFDGHALAEAVPREAVLHFLRSLMHDHGRRKPAEIAAFMEEVLRESGQHVIRESTTVEEADGEVLSVWSLETLVRHYLDIAKTKIYYSGIGFLKSSKAEEIKQKFNKEITFNPNINDMSKILSQIRDQKILMDNNVKEPEKISRVDILYHEHNVRAQRLEHKKKIAEIERYKECTFTPNLRDTLDYNNRQSQRVTRVTPDEVVDRLYVTQKEKYEMLSQIREDKRLRQELAEIQQCTFRPKINDLDRIEDLRSLYDQSQLPVHYIKSVERLRTANEKHQELKRKREHVPRGENYERRKTEKVAPPSCADPARKSKSRVPYVQFDVNIGPGKTGRLAICEGDDPADKARSFAAAFQLKPEMEANLRKMIEENLQRYYAS